MMRVRSCVRALVPGMLVLMLLIPAASARQADTGAPMNLALLDALKMSMANNLDIKVAKHYAAGPGAGHLLPGSPVRSQRGGVDLIADNTFPTTNVFDVSLANPGTLVSIEQDINDFTAGFSDRLRYGASYSAGLDFRRVNTSSANALFTPSYATALVLAYSQSLLRNMGHEVNEAQITVARTNEEISRSQVRQSILASLKSTEDAYWELVFARADLEVKKHSLGLAGELLKLNQIKVQVGTLPPIEITTAEAEVAARDQDVIVAENNVSDAEDTLRRAMNLPKADNAWAREIIPTDQPDYVAKTVNLEQDMATAMEKRPDMQQARLDITNSDTRMNFEENQRKWDLTFNANYRIDGLGGDIRIVDPSDPNLTPTIPAGSVLFQQDQNFGDSVDVLDDVEFDSWNVGLNLSIPLGNRAADAQFVGRRLEKEQSEIRYENTRLGAEVEVRNAARAILTNTKRINAADKNVELQTKKVEAEQKKFENGMSTSFQVLSFQKDLTDALGARNRALVDYRKSITTYELARGTLDDYLRVQVQ